MNCSSGSGLTFYLLTSKERGRAKSAEQGEILSSSFITHHGCTADAGRELHAAPVNPPVLRPVPAPLLAPPHPTPPGKRSGPAEKRARPPRPALTRLPGPAGGGERVPTSWTRPSVPSRKHAASREGAGDGKDLPCSLATIKVAVS